MRKFAISLALVFLSASAGGAQDKPNFTGKWVLDRAKSDFGQFPAPDSQTNLVDHKEPRIQVTQTIKGEAVPGGEDTAVRQFTTDGKESLNRAGEREIKSTTRWEGNKLATTARLEVPDGTVVITDLWELTGNGRQMTITRVFKGPNGERTQKLLFHKQ